MHARPTSFFVFGKELRFDGALCPQKPCDLLGTGKWLGLGKGVGGGRVGIGGVYSGYSRPHVHLQVLEVF